MVLAALIAAVGIFLDSRDPDRRRDGRRPRVRPDRRLLRRARPAPPRARAALGDRARRRLPARDHGARTSPRSSSRRPASTPDDFDASEHELANLISSPDVFAFFVAALRRRRRHALALDREVRRADRRADLRHDDPRRRQHRRRRGLPRLATLARLDRAAGASTSPRSSSPAPPCWRSSALLYARRRRHHLRERQPADTGSARAERRPDVDLRADLLDHRVGELAWSWRGRRGRSSSTPVGDRLQHALVDRARGPLGAGDARAAGVAAARAPQASSIAIGFARSLPISDGAVPCGASAIATSTS